MTSIDPPADAFPCIDCGNEPCTCDEYLNPVSLPVDPPTIEGTEVSTDVDTK